VEGHVLAGRFQTPTDKLEIPFNPNGNLSVTYSVLLLNSERLLKGTPHHGQINGSEINRQGLKQSMNPHIRATLIFAYQGRCNFPCTKSKIGFI